MYHAAHRGSPPTQAARHSYSAAYQQGPAAVGVGPWGIGVRVAQQDLEVGEVSQRGGQGGDALVGEVVVAQAARARGRGGGCRGRSAGTSGGPQRAREGAWHRM